MNQQDDIWNAQIRLIRRAIKGEWMEETDKSTAAHKNNLSIKDELFNKWAYNFGINSSSNPELSEFITSFITVKHIYSKVQIQMNKIKTAFGNKIQITTNKNKNDYQNLQTYRRSKTVELQNERNCCFSLAFTGFGNTRIIQNIVVLVSSFGKWLSYYLTNGKQGGIIQVSGQRIPLVMIDK